MKKIEIEQKYLYKYRPDQELECVMHSVVHRKYLSLNPEVRINRRIFDCGEERYHLTIKTGDYFAREEIKIRLTRIEYEEISQLIPFEDIVIEVFEYKLDQTHLISFKECINVDVSFAEIEYADQKDFDMFAGTVARKDYLAEEVTWNPNYYMKNIWERKNARGR